MIRSSSKNSTEFSLITEAGHPPVLLAVAPTGRRAETLGAAIEAELESLGSMDADALRTDRADKFLAIGA